jgi:hypothetical protein
MPLGRGLALLWYTTTSSPEHPSGPIRAVETTPPAAPGNDTSSSPPPADGSSHASITNAKHAMQYNNVTEAGWGCLHVILLVLSSLRALFSVDQDDGWCPEAAAGHMHGSEA